MPGKFYCQFVMPSKFSVTCCAPNRAQILFVALVLLLHLCLLFIAWPQFRHDRVPARDLMVSVSIQAPTTALPEKSSPIRTVRPPAKKAVAEMPAINKREQPEAVNLSEPVADIPPAAALTSSKPDAADSEPDYRADYLRNPPPLYPVLARRMGWHGKVILNVEVLADGRCGDVGVFQSSGHRILDDAALEAVRQWRFVPATHAGIAVTKWFKIPINFSLEG